MTVLDAIDRPIRDLVVNINRIGLKTVFSCCGFTYPDEEEPKSHGEDAFVIFKDPEDAMSCHNFLIFTDFAFRCGWKVMRYSTDQWTIRFEAAPEQKKYWAKPSLHDYELNSIAIYKLNRVMGQISTYKSDFEIVDGNAWYYEQGIHWQVQPKENALISVEKEKVLESSTM